LGIPQNNFAFGGAQTATGPIPNSGFTQQTRGFVASGKTIAPSDLVEISIGGNDARGYYQGGGTLAGVNAAATVSANQAMAGINALVGAGARNIVFTVGDVSQLPEAIGNPNAPVGSAYSQNYNAQMQAALAGIARNGVRVEFIDVALLGNLIKANPALYGISNVGACPFPACVGNAAPQNQFLFYLDGIHLTSHGFAIMGQHIVNRLDAPLTFAPQGDLAMNSAMGFASELYGKLDMFRETCGFYAVDSERLRGVHQGAASQGAAAGARQSVVVLHAGQRQYRIGVRPGNTSRRLSPACVPAVAGALPLLPPAASEGSHVVCIGRVGEQLSAFRSPHATM
jgi:outer membrane lipase/esterase